MAPFSDRDHVTRVIQVEGPSDIVNEEFLLAYFRTKCRFDMERVSVLWEGFSDVPVNGGQPPAAPAAPVPAAAPAPAPARRQGRALASMNWRERSKPVTAEPEPEAQGSAAVPTTRRHIRIMEFRFGTVKGQALACRMALDWEFKERGVLCRYGKSSSALGGGDTC